MRDASAFLRASGFGTAQRVPLPGDTSLRRYERLIGARVPALLMDAPLPEDVRPFVKISRFLYLHGFSVPEVYYADEENGFLLIEDFGDATHASLLTSDQIWSVIYQEAAYTLAAIHTISPPSDLPLWDAEAMSKAASTSFLDWWWPAAMGSHPSQLIRDELDTAIRAMLTPFTGGDFVHRDYFANNLMRLSDRYGVRRTGVIDFQDAAIGHGAYDMVSLLEDARRDVPESVRRAALNTYLNGRPTIDRTEFCAAMTAHSAMRHLRVVGLLVRSAKRDGKPQYLIHGLRCWAMLARSLQDSVTAPLSRFVDQHIPHDMRRNPIDVVL